MCHSLLDDVDINDVDNTAITSVVENGYLSYLPEVTLTKTFDRRSAVKFYRASDNHEADGDSREAHDNLPY